MNQEINVKSISALLDMKSSFARYRSDTGNELTKIGQKLDQQQNSLREQASSSQRQLEMAHAQKREHELSSMHSDSYDSYSNNSYQDTYYLDNKIQEIEEKLRKIRHFSRSLDDAIYEYRREANKLKQMLSSDIPKAEIFLDRKATELQSYIALSNAPVNTSTSTEKSAPSIASNLGKLENKQSDEAASNENDVAFKVLQPISNTEARIVGVGEGDNQISVGYIKKDLTTGFYYDLTDRGGTLNVISIKGKASVISMSTAGAVGKAKVKLGLDIASAEGEIGINSTGLVASAELNAVKVKAKVPVSAKAIYGQTLKPTYQNYISPVLNELLNGAGYFIEAISTLDEEVLSVKGHVAVGYKAKLGADGLGVTNSFLQGIPFHFGLKLDVNFNHFATKSKDQSSNDMEK